MTMQSAIETREQLVERIENVRQEITETLLKIDHILLQVNPRIESDYAVKIGCYENELLQAQISARRAKRKFELAQARVNRGEGFADSALEATLDEEFEAWEIQLSLQVQDYYNKLEERASTRVLSPHRARRLRALHRELVKRLHPDLHPAQTPEEERLFAIVQAAYKAGDLESLESIEVATTYLANCDAVEYESEDELYAELELLCAQLNVTKERLNAIKGQAPYSFGDKLNDLEWVRRRVQDLKSQIAEQDEAARAYTQQYEALKEVHHDG